MAKYPLASIVLVSCNSRAGLARALPSITQQRYPYYEIVVVDNGSTDGTSTWVKTNYPDVRLITNEQNVGVAAAMNQGFALSLGNIFVGLSPHATVDQNWLVPLIQATLNPRVALVSSHVISLSENQSEQEAQQAVKPTKRPTVEQTTTISSISFAMSRQRYEMLGGFDPDYFDHFADLDLSWRARVAGFQVVTTPNSVVYDHPHEQPTSRELFWAERNRYLILLTYLKKPILTRMLPALVVGELLTVASALLHGPRTLEAKFQAMIWLVRNRHRVQSIRAGRGGMRPDETDTLTTFMTPLLQQNPTMPTSVKSWMTSLVTPLLS